MASKIPHPWLFIVLIAVAAIFIKSSFAQTDRYQTTITPDLVRLMEKGRVLRTNGQFDKSIEILDSVLKKQPDYYLASYNRALALAEKCGKNEDSTTITAVIASFDTSISIMKRFSIPDPSIYNSKGWFLLTINSSPCYARGVERIELCFK